MRAPGEISPRPRNLRVTLPVGKRSLPEILRRHRHALRDLATLVEFLLSTSPRSGDARPTLMTLLDQAGASAQVRRAVKVRNDSVHLEPSWPAPSEVRILEHAELLYRFARRVARRLPRPLAREVSGKPTGLDSTRWPDRRRSKSFLRRVRRLERVLARADRISGTAGRLSASSSDLQAAVSRHALRIWSVSPRDVLAVLDPGTKARASAESVLDRAVRDLKTDLRGAGDPLYLRPICKPSLFAISLEPDLIDQIHDLYAWLAHQLEGLYDMYPFPVAASDGGGDFFSRWNPLTRRSELCPVRPSTLQLLLAFEDRLFEARNVRWAFHIRNRLTHSDPDGEALPWPELVRARDSMLAAACSLLHTRHSTLRESLIAGDCATVTFPPAVVRRIKSPKRRLVALELRIRGRLLRHFAQSSAFGKEPHLALPSTSQLLRLLPDVGRANLAERVLPAIRQAEELRQDPLAKTSIAEGHLAILTRIAKTLEPAVAPPYTKGLPVMVGARRSGTSEFERAVRQRTEFGLAENSLRRALNRVPWGRVAAWTGGACALVVAGMYSLEWTMAVAIAGGIAVWVLWNVYRGGKLAAAWIRALIAEWSLAYGPDDASPRLRAFARVRIMTRLPWLAGQVGLIVGLFPDYRRFLWTGLFLSWAVVIRRAAAAIRWRVNGDTVFIAAACMIGTVWFSQVLDVETPWALGIFGFAIGFLAISLLDPSTAPAPRWASNRQVGLAPPAHLRNKEDDFDDDPDDDIDWADDEPDYVFVEGDDIEEFDDDIDQEQDQDDEPEYEYDYGWSEQDYYDHYEWNDLYFGDYSGRPDASPEPPQIT